MNSGRKVSPTQVTLLIESITDVSEVNMDLTITFVIYQTWTDPRLMIPTDVLPLKRYKGEKRNHANAV